MNVNFVTISNHRTGSSFFQRLLDSHPDIQARQEDLRNSEGGELEIYSIFDEVYGGARRSEVLGIKVQNSHMNQSVIKYIKEHNIKVIQLVRNDLLDTAVWLKDNHEGNSEGGEGPPLIVREPVIAKIDEVLNYMEWVRAKNDEYAKIADIVVRYEEFTKGNPPEECYNIDEMNRVMDFLEVEQCELWDTQRKNIREENEKLITNWDELLAEMNKRKIKRYYFNE